MCINDMVPEKQNGYTGDQGSFYPVYERERERERERIKGKEGREVKRICEKEGGKIA